MKKFKFLLLHLFFFIILLFPTYFAHAELSAGSVGAQCEVSIGCIPGNYCNPKTLTCMVDDRMAGDNIKKLKEGDECKSNSECGEDFQCLGSYNSTIFHCKPNEGHREEGSTHNTHGYNPPIEDVDSNFVQTLIGNVISKLLPIVGALFLVMFIYGGFLYLTAGGDSAKVDLAHKTFLNATIGMAMVFCANFIITYFISALGR